MGFLFAFKKVKKSDFESCLASGRHAKFVQSQYDQALAAGGQGTPFNIVVSPKGKTFVVPGALPYAQFEQTIKQALES